MKVQDYTGSPQQFVMHIINLSVVLGTLLFDYQVHVKYNRDLVNMEIRLSGLALDEDMEIVER